MTGVQTCALPIFGEVVPAGSGYKWAWFYSAALTPNGARRLAEDAGYRVVRCSHVRRVNAYRVFVSAGPGV